MSSYKIKQKYINKIKLRLKKIDELKTKNK